jgi:serine/threonine protein kinase
MNLAAWSATMILAVPDSEPERLFSGPETAKDEYRALAKQWHPDVNKAVEADSVTAHINRLFAAAEAKIAKGSWHTPGLLVLTGKDGRQRKIRYRARHPFELGEMLYGNTIICWLVRTEFADLVESARRLIGGFKYASAAMRTEVERYLPRIKQIFETQDDFCAVIMQKTADVFLLRDLMTACGGKLDPKHAAWVVSSLCNIACYLEYAGLTHNAISPDTYFVSPEHHSGMLYGGWWYAVRSGGKLSALPSRSRAIAPRTMLAAKRADESLDRLLIRATGREALGDITGMTLARAAPQPMIDFLRRPSAGSATADYSAWFSTVLPASFGARRFVKLELSDSDIFKE